MHSHASPSEKGDTLRSVRRALDVLDLLAQHPDGLLVKSISLKLRLNISTCYHLVNTLLTAGYAERETETQLIRLGAKVSLLSSSASESFAQRTARAEMWTPVRPLLYRLTESTHAASYLAAWQDGDAVIQSIVEGITAEKIPGLYVGYRGASHVHALGRALLSFDEPNVLDRYLDGRERPDLAAVQAVDRQALRTLLAEVQRCGYALDLEELVPGTCCVSAPVLGLDQHGRQRPLAAIAVSLPATHFLRHRDWIIRQVLVTSAEAARVLGHQCQTTVAG